MPKVVIALVGPTAIGKTSRAIDLANHFRTDIFSADSRQFFKEMNIGTAVPSASELKAANHHFIQHKSIFQTYSVGDYEREALSAMENLFREKDTVILVGGSGLYIDAVLYGLDNFPQTPPKIRERLNTILKEEGISTLRKQLEDLDPDYHSKVDLNNPHRIIRALEICITSGRPYSTFLNKKKADRKFKFLLLGLHAEREIIYERINTRVDEMLKQGLLKEAGALYPNRTLNALNTVGYKELFDHFDGKISLKNAVEEIKKNTRRFAKRQLTWYRKNKDVHWLDYDLPQDVFITTIERKIKNLVHGPD